ncbi:protein of unknown function DUF107 [Gloeothece citriformis PCC 7424]|uniref:NfeD-like C-terminal domain-containing protein n=1 Tax=Gloeothece citriformis (strain PCC 7424) TaxID=65393 RepID=B7KHH3_GLOC7|nr:NfeD family protein [Gloeothece citriformis]ACK70668.1 protein of unknown function DUF107 [Gloeothece citriformis PCC 7424]
MLSSPVIWLIAGSILCLMEFIFPTAFVAFMMGISAFVVALIAFLVPHLGTQVVLWLILSTISIILSRRWLTPRKNLRRLSEDTEGQTLTEIAPGQAGRVLYEGNSWRAMCDDETLSIPAHQKVYIVRRKGNTLFVVPANLLHS